MAISVASSGEKRAAGKQFLAAEGNLVAGRRIEVDRRLGGFRPHHRTDGNQPTDRRCRCQEVLAIDAVRIIVG